MKDSVGPVSDSHPKVGWITPELTRMEVEQTLSGNPNAQGETFASDTGIKEGNVAGS